MPKPKKFGIFQQSKPFDPRYAGDLNYDKGHSVSERKKQIDRIKAEREDILKQMPK